MDLEEILSIRGVSVSLRPYQGVSGKGRVQILSDLWFSLGAGERVAITGPSGAGKTTLLMVIAGMEVPTLGSVQLFGHELEGMGEDARAGLRRRKLGILFQSFHLIPTMTALENVALPLELNRDRGARDQAGHWLERMGLGDRRTHFPGELSGGEQQRVGLARALVARPGLVLADEPTGNLDGGTAARMRDLLFATADQEGFALILVTHDLALAETCQRVVRMESGTLPGAKDRADA